MNGAGFLFGALAAVSVRRYFDARLAESAPAEFQTAFAMHQAEINEARRLEDLANAQPVQPIAPPLPAAAYVGASDASFGFGIPRGYAPLPPPMVQQWEELQGSAAGSTLATVAETGADGLPMLISVDATDAIDVDSQRALWRLTLDQRESVRAVAAQHRLHMTEGPSAALVGGSRAIWFATTGEEAGNVVRTWQCYVLHLGRALGITLNVRPEVESRHLPAWWTVLGTWTWRQPWEGQSSTLYSPPASQRETTPSTKRPRIFLSYRRKDTATYASFLAYLLTEQLGADSVFMDIDSIQPGTDFTKAIVAAISSSDVVLVLIGPSWLTTTDQSDRIRLREPDDLVRFEIEEALRQNRRVLPVLVGGATMPTSASLPDSIRPLAHRHAFELSDNRWQADVRELTRILRPAG